MSNYLEDLRHALGDAFRDEDIPMYLIACEISMLRESMEEILDDISCHLEKVHISL